MKHSKNVLIRDVNLNIFFLNEKNTFKNNIYINNNADQPNKYEQTGEYLQIFQIEVL